MSQIPTLEGLSDAQLGHIVNGCGGIGFDVPDWIFYAACKQHDLDYWIGCIEVDRKTADLTFYTGMKAAAAKLTWYKRWFYYGMAYSYYKSVRLFAAKHFYVGPDKRTVDDLAAEMGATSLPPPLPAPAAAPETSALPTSLPNVTTDQTPGEQIVS